jgi:hypothetical protein
MSTTRFAGSEGSEIQSPARYVAASAPSSRCVQNARSSRFLKDSHCTSSTIRRCVCMKTRTRIGAGRCAVSSRSTKPRVVTDDS